MRRLVSGLLSLALLVSALGACAQGQDKGKAQSPQEQFEALMGEFNKAQQEAIKAFREAKTSEERAKIKDEFMSKKPKEYTGKFLAIAENHPKEDVAVESLRFVISTTKEGPDLDKAIALILKDQLGKIGIFIGTMAQSQSPAAEKFLNSVLEKSKDRNIQGLATLGLAQIAKGKLEGLKTDTDHYAKLSKEAEDLFDKVATKFADTDAGKAAKKELFEVRNLSIGKTPPDISGEDSDGKKFKLSDYKGKVVVLDFWASWCGPCMALVPHERSMVEKLQGKPFALLGVNLDDSKAKQKETEEKNKINWRSFHDGAQGGISDEWNIRAIPAIYVLDHRGVIRFKNVTDKDLEEAVESLLKEVK